MAERPTPRSIAVCALIALQSDPSSPLHDIELNPHEQDALTTFLEESVFRNATNADSLLSWIQQVRQRVGDEVAELLTETLAMASDSVDSLVDLMESLRVAISEGLVDAVGAHGVFLRQMCLGFEELSFESVTLLWQELKERLSRVDQLEDPTEEKHPAWPLSTAQVERLLRQGCFHIDQGPASARQSFESVELQIRHMLQKDPELPAAYFLRFLNCLRHEERVGALHALHQYFDHAMVKHTSPKDILQFSAILLAITHSSFGDKGLALMATEEAVRVAQQSKDAACVAFALGWLFENDGHGTAERRELLKRCATRAAQGQLRPLVAGSNLALAKQYLEEDRRDPTSAWTSLMEVISEQAADNLPSLDRPTFMTQVPKDAMASLTRQRLVSAGIWDAFSMPALSGLSSIVAMESHQDASSADILTAIHNVSRLVLYGTSSSLFFHAKFESSSTTDDNASIYSKVVSTLMNFRQNHGLEGNRFDDPFLHTIVLVLHEWAVNCGDVDGAQALGIVLESYSYPGLANYDHFVVDVGMQKCLLLCRKQDWETARTVAARLLRMCETKGLKSHRARILIQLAIMELESNPKHSISALPPLLEALSMCEKCEQHGLHAAALSVLAKVFLRLQNPKRSLAILKATIPTLLQREHIWFQAEAYLTYSKCHLQLANISTGSARRKQLQGASAGLKKTQSLFEQCQDIPRLREVYYLQARIFSQLQIVAERNSASLRFTSLCDYMGRRRFSSILDVLIDPVKVQVLTGRSV
jgi:hypothetical protein